MTSKIDPDPSPKEVSMFRHVYTKAAELLSRDGVLQPVAFFRAGEKPRLKGPTKGVIVPVQMDMPGNDHGKNAVAEVLRHLVKDLDADMVLMVLESWMVKPSDLEAEYWKKEGCFQVPPSKHPRRIEIVLFHLSKPGGDSWSAWVEIQRDAHNNPSIPTEPPKLEYLQSDGRFGNLFDEEGGEDNGKSVSAHPSSTFESSQN